jgi:hypothetical protein
MRKKLIFNNSHSFSSLYCWSVMQSDGYSPTSNLSKNSHDQGLCMLIAKSRFETLKAVAYLKKFCRHFAHKLTAEFDDSHGHIDFPFGDCRLQSSENLLTFTVEAESEESLEKMQAVVAGHMERFAFRDEISLVWERQ